jgi:crotonobetainyl-CoA:carnitine CoA-transferase CaiB-like acyl-CoA transferase
MTETPLAGVRIIDLTRVLAGPFCTMMLSDLGAEVIKVENPAVGDETRHFKTPGREGESPYFMAINRNKKSLAIDFTKPEGAAALKALAAKSDVVLEAMRTGTMDRYGLGYEDLKDEFPSLIYCSISGYGRTGPLKDRGGYDPVAQAEVGLMALTGEADGPPMRVGVSLFDVMAGQYAAQAILAALVARGRTGKGQSIDVPIYDSSLSVMHPYLGRYLVEGIDELRVGNSSLVAQPLGAYEASDGPFLLTIAGDALYVKFCNNALDRPDLAEDPRFSRNAARVTNRLALKDELEAIFASGTVEYWLERLLAAGIPAGAIRSTGEALDSYETKARGLITEAPHTSEGTVPVVRSPLHFSGTPVREPMGAPLLGQHSEEVLRETLGYSAAEVAALISSGVLRAPE